MIPDYVQNIETNFIELLYIMFFDADVSVDLSPADKVSILPSLLPFPFHIQSMTPS